MNIREWSADCYGCSCNLDDAPALEAALRRGAEAVGATILGSSCTRYQPIGVTVFLPLAESHTMVSTWPEYRYALVSILLCNDQMDPGAVFEAIREVLHPADVKVHTIEHRVESEP
jgi:S-adenosylmethionine decarboxylase